MQQRRFAASEPLLIEGYSRMMGQQERIPFDSKMQLTNALRRLVQLYDGWRKSAQASELAG